jgi:hypothetical protein
MQIGARREHRHERTSEKRREKESASIALAQPGYESARMALVPFVMVG